MICGRKFRPQPTPPNAIKLACDGRREVNRIYMEIIDEEIKGLLNKMM